MSTWWSTKSGTAGETFRAVVPFAGSRNDRLTKSELYWQFEATPLWSVMLIVSLPMPGSSASDGPSLGACVTQLSGATVCQATLLSGGDMPVALPSGPTWPLSGMARPLLSKYVSETPPSGPMLPEMLPCSTLPWLWSQVAGAPALAPLAVKLTVSPVSRLMVTGPGNPHWSQSAACAGAVGLINPATAATTAAANNGDVLKNVPFDMRYSISQDLQVIDPRSANVSSDE